jgi:predicted nicotinamide N-methyase
MICVVKTIIFPGHYLIRANFLSRVKKNVYNLKMHKKTIKYPTLIKQRTIGGKLFVLETIRDLDEAIDIICDLMSEEEKLDPFSEDLCPYFGILWESSEALSIYLNNNSHLIKNKKVLELGCGLGLPSLVGSFLGGDVLASDFHPDVEEYFLRNCRHSNLDVGYRRLNWRENLSSVGQFDVVIGSDVLYESKHPKELAEGLLKFVSPGGVLILSDPGRAYLQQFINTMNEYGLKEEMSLVNIGSKDIFLLKYQT